MKFGEFVNLNEENLKNSKLIVKDRLPTIENKVKNLKNIENANGLIETMVTLIHECLVLLSKLLKANPEYKEEYKDDLDSMSKIINRNLN